MKALVLVRMVYLMTQKWEKFARDNDDSGVDGKKKEILRRDGHWVLGNGRSAVSRRRLEEFL